MPRYGAQKRPPGGLPENDQRLGHRENQATRRIPETDFAQLIPGMLGIAEPVGTWERG